MTKILFVLPAETILDAQSRVMGWRSTPALREHIRELKALAPRLKELGAQRVISSDLDGQSGWCLARQLGVKCEEWFTLRRFNFGNRHGIKRDEAAKLLGEWEEKWQKAPAVPIPNGDSKISYSNRIAALKEKLPKQNGVAAVVVVIGPDELQKVTGANIKFERNRIYEWAG